MEIGIVGLPNVGKSTLFNSLTNAHAASSNYPFTTIEPNVGVVSVPDARLARLAELFSPEKVTPTAMHFVDIAGLVKGASEGAGLGNQFLANIREVDAIAQVVRLFEDEDVVHTLGPVDPLRDIEIIETELALADLQSVEKQLEKTQQKAKSGNKEAIALVSELEQIKSALDEGRSARTCGLSQEQLKKFSLLTGKPILYVGNIDETDSPKQQEWIAQLAKFATERNAQYLTLCGKLEAEIAALETEEEKAAFRSELGLKETGLERLIRISYQLLGLQTFLTAGVAEVRAWTVKVGACAVEAAAQIHTDIAKGFIKADVYRFADIDALGSEKAVQEKGLKRSEGRDYIMHDGDVCYFHFR